MEPHLDARVGRIGEWRIAADLPELELRALASSADPTERVWAAWALALRLGRASVPSARASLATEPAPGIRCQLVVVLAGLGEHALLRTIATSDPDATVRGTACQYVIRTSSPGSETARAFALERMGADVPRITHAMLEEVLAHRLDLPDEVLAELLTRPDVEMRRLVIEVIEAREHLSDAVGVGLLRLVPMEEDPDLLARTIRRVLREGANAALVECVSRAPEPRVLLVLASLAVAGLRFSWRELEILARRPGHGITASLLPLLAVPLERDTIRWLCACAAEDELAWRVLPLIYDALSTANIDLIDARVARLLLRQFEDSSDPDDDFPWEPSPFDIEKRQLLEARVGIAGVVR